MAVTTGNALKALIEGLGLSITCYRDRPNEGKAAPYVTITEQVSLVADPETARYDRSMTPAFVERVQIDLWQTWKDETNTVVETYALAGGLAKGLDGARLATSPTRVWGLLLEMAGPRILELENNLVHHVFQVAVVRDLY